MITTSTDFDVQIALSDPAGKHLGWVRFPFKPVRGLKFEHGFTTYKITEVRFISEHTSNPATCVVTVY